MATKKTGKTQTKNSETKSADVAPYLSKKSEPDSTPSSGDSMLIPAVLILVLAALIYSGFFKQGQETVAAVSPVAPVSSSGFETTNTSQDTEESLFKHFYLTIKDLLLINPTATTESLTASTEDTLIVETSPEDATSQDVKTSSKDVTMPDTETESVTQPQTAQTTTGTAPYQTPQQIAQPRYYRPYWGPYSPPYPPEPYGYGYDDNRPAPMGRYNEPSPAYREMMEQRKQYMEEARQKQMEAMKKYEDERRAILEKLNQKREETYRAYRESLDKQTATDDTGS